MRRRLFQRLEQRIERALREHVDLVDQVNLVAPACWRVLHVIEHIAGVVDLRLGCGVDLNKVNKAPLIDLDAGAAFPARLRRNALLTVKRLGENTSNRGLADSPGAREQVSMMQAPGVQRIDQGLEYVLLANRVREVFGPPFAGQDEITHK